MSSGAWKSGVLNIPYLLTDVYYDLNLNGLKIVSIPVLLNCFRSGRLLLTKRKIFYLWMIKINNASVFLHSCAPKTSVCIVFQSPVKYLGGKITNLTTATLPNIWWQIKCIWWNNEWSLMLQVWFSHVYI